MQQPTLASLAARAAAWMMLWIGAALLVGPSRAQEPSPVTLEVPGRTNLAPWIASHGTFVAVTWGAQTDGAWDIYVAVSDDSGRTFGYPVRVNAIAGEGRVSGEIPPRVALHLPAGASRPEVVVAWNATGQGTEIKAARSRDLGRTFTTPVSLQDAGAPGDRGWHALTIDTRGRAHVVWLDHRGLAAAKTEAGDSHGEHDGVAMAQRSRLHHAIVGDAAASRGRRRPTRSADRALAAGVCYCCKTALASTGRGVLAAWRHVYPGNMRDIAFAWLTAPAAAEPARISEDGWSIHGCPDDGPALAVSAGDRVHAVWPTVIPGAEPVGALFYASLADGGGFTPRQRVPTLGGPKPSHPQIAVDGAGRLFIAWDEFVDGARTAAAVSATVRDGQLQFSEPVRLATAAPSTYPVMAPLADGVIAAFTTGPPQDSVIMVRRVTATAAPSTPP
jgi:hypothetical protein